VTSARPYPQGVAAPDPTATAGARAAGGVTAWVWEHGDGGRVPARGDANLAAVRAAAGEWGDGMAVAIRSLNIVIAYTCTRTHSLACPLVPLSAPFKPLHGIT